MGTPLNGLNRYVQRQRVWICPLSVVLRFACSIGQSANIWVWVSSEVITIVHLVDDRSADCFAFCYTVLTRPNKVEAAVHDWLSARLDSISCRCFYVVTSLATLLFPFLALQILPTPTAFSFAVSYTKGCGFWAVLIWKGPVEILIILV